MTVQKTMYVHVMCSALVFPQLTRLTAALSFCGVAKPNSFFTAVVVAGEIPTTAI